MNKKIKIISLVIIGFLLTGCSFKYDVKIMTDGSVEESADVVFDDSYFMDKDKNVFPNKVIKKSLEETSKVYKKKSGDIEIINKTNHRESIITNKYESYMEYRQESEFYKTLYNDVSIITTGNTVRITTSELLVSSSSANLEYYENSYVAISLPFKVIDHNADKVDESSNTYYWYMDDSTKIKNIDLSYNKEKYYTINYFKILPYTGLSSIFVIILILIVVIVLIAIFAMGSKIIRKNN